MQPSHQNCLNGDGGGAKYEVVAERDPPSDLQRSVVGVGGGGGG